MEKRSDLEDEKKTAAPKRQVMAVGVRRAGGSWLIRSRLRIERAEPERRPSLDHHAA